MYAENLKAIRKKLRYTADEMAEILGVKPRTYGSWEREGKTPSMELGTLLNQKLNINLNWFCTGVGEMFNNNQTPDDKEKIRGIFNELLKEHGLIE